MNKTEFINAVAEKSGLSKVDAKKSRHANQLNSKLAPN